MRPIVIRHFLVCFILICSTGSFDDCHSKCCAQESKTTIFLIGNSLTWDTVPSRLEGAVQWHVDCGKSLPWMYENPEKPCVKSSRLWPQALKEKQYDYLSIQPHYGSTLESDLATISKWIKLQPRAIVVIHSGWAKSKTRADEFQDLSTNKMTHSPEYISQLLTKLRKTFPTREFRCTRTTELLDRVASDIKSGRAPLNKIEDLYRDAIHMKVDSGRYLMHNAMRVALDQPLSGRGFKIDPKVKKYFDALLRSSSKDTEGKKAEMLDRK